MKQWQIIVLHAAVWIICTLLIGDGRRSHAYHSETGKLVKPFRMASVGPSIIAFTTDVVGKKQQTASA